jgi:hypothetical protein
MRGADSASAEKARYGWVILSREAKLEERARLDAEQ